MSARASTPSDDDLAAVRAALLETAERETGWPNDDKPPGMTRAAIHRHLIDRGGHKLNDVERALIGAVADGDLFRWEGEHHKWHARADETGLRKVRAEQASQGIPDRELFDRVCGRLQEVADAE